MTHPVETVKAGWESLKSAASGLAHPIENIKNKIQEQQTSAQQNQSIMAGLAKQYDSAKQKVEELTKQYQESVEKTGVASDGSIELANSLSKAQKQAGEAEKAMTDFAGGEDEAGEEAEETEGKLAKLAKTMGKGLVAAAKVGAAGMAAAGAAIGKVLFDSVSKYADFEQIRDGTKKIFDEVDYSTIAADANDAYKTMGLSASQYLESINKVGGTFASTMGDQKGYETAKLGMQAIADYASGTGADVNLLNEKFQMITRATSQYQSIADQFSGILPQTNADFLKQAQAAGYLSDSYTELTKVPVAEYQEAVAKMLEKGVADMGFANNASKEAFGTLSGSINTTKTAWENLIVGLTDSEADLGQLVSNLVEGATAMARNIVPAAKQALSSMSTVLPELVNEAGQALVGLISDLLPDLVKTAVGLVNSLIDTLVDNADQLVDAAIAIVSELLNGLLTAAPKLITGAFQLIAELARGLGEALPSLIPQVVNLVIQMALALTDPSGLAAILNGALSLMQGLANGILAALPLVINAIPVIIQNLIDFIVQNLPQFLVQGTQIIVQLAVGIIQAIPDLLAKLPEILDAIVNGLVEMAPQLWEAGKQMAGEIWNGIKSIFGGKKVEQVDVSSSFDFNTVGTEAQQTASTVSTAFSGMNTSLDLSAASTSATTQFNAISTSATTAKDNVVNSFTGMGTEIGNSIASSQGNVDWSALESGAKNAAQNMKSAFQNLPEQMRAIWTKIKSVYNEVPSYFQKQFSVAKQNVMFVWSTVPEEFRAIWTSIKTVFTDAGTSFKTIGESMHTNLMDGLNLDSITQKIQNAVNNGNSGGTTGTTGGGTNKPKSYRYGATATGTDTDKKVAAIYTILSTYLPEIAEKTGVVNIGTIDNQLGFRAAMAGRGNA